MSIYNRYKEDTHYEKYNFMNSWSSNWNITLLKRNLKVKLAIKTLTLYLWGIAAIILGGKKLDLKPGEQISTVQYFWHSASKQVKETAS